MAGHSTKKRKAGPEELTGLGPVPPPLGAHPPISKVTAAFDNYGLAKDRLSSTSSFLPSKFQLSHAFCLGTM